MSVLERWRHRLPTNRQRNERWRQLIEVITEAYEDWISPEVDRLRHLYQTDCHPADRTQRLADFNTRFMEAANHIAPELAIEHVKKLTSFKNTATLWAAYGRQLGFHEEDIVIENKRSDSPEEYGRSNYNELGRVHTSRIALVLSLENARWLSQPIASPANLLQDYALRTRPAHTVVEPVILQTKDEKESAAITLWSGYENEHVCRISV